MRTPKLRKILALLTLTSLVIQVVPALSGRTPISHAGGVGITVAPFPRIANYDGFTTAAQAPIFSRYGLDIAWDSMTWTHPDALSALHAANPNATLIAYERTVLLDYTNLTRYGSGAIYPGWWLLQPGSTLSSAIDSSQTTIPVRSTAPFALYDDVLVDGESMHVVGINASANTLTVWRGFYSTASAHNSGARIATHNSIPTGGAVLTNQDPVNDPAMDRPWALNVSSVCPRNAQGQRWVDYLASWMQSTIMSSGLWNGIFYDNSNDVLADPNADVDNDGTADSGVVNGVNVWQQGLAALYSETRANFPAAMLLGTGYNFGEYGSANGENIYADPSNPTYWSSLAQNYQYHMQNSAGPQMSIFNPNQSSGSPSLKTMRYGLTTALLSDGSYSFDRGATQNGTPWWFDEYDNGAGTALTASVSATSTQLPVARSASFATGQSVQVEGELMTVTAVASGLLGVTRGQGGTTAASHSAGSVVATAQQVQAGLGYLGQALGAAYPVQAPGANLLANPSFDLGTLAPWSLYLMNGAAGTASLDTGNQVDGAASAKIVASTVTSSDVGVQFGQTNLSLVGSKSYQLTFSAMSSIAHTVHVLICSASTSPACFGDSVQPLTTSWQQHSLTFTMPSSAADVRVQFELGDKAATTWIDATSLASVPNPLQRRDFTNGTVLVNPSSQTYSVTLPSGYCHLQGDQNPSLNDGATATSVSVPGQDGVILVKCGILGTGSPTQTSTPTDSATPTYTPTAAARNTATATHTAIPLGHGHGDQYTAQRQIRELFRKSRRCRRDRLLHLHTFPIRQRHHRGLRSQFGRPPYARGVRRERPATGQRHALGIL